MTTIIASPTRYIQGDNALAEIRRHVEPLGKKLLILASASGKARVENLVAESLAGSACSAHYELFNGECSRQEIQRIRAVYEQTGCDLVVGVGGGKIHDTAKAVAYYVHCPVVIVPTVASTDAPCSALSVIYSESGVFEEYLFLPTNPDVVLVDTGIVSRAPARLLIAGMGDALSTYFEARACARSCATNCVGGKPTLAAQGLARLCYDTLLADGVQAALAVREQACTKALENIIEANTYLSGVGFESGGLAGAHAIHNGFTALPETHALYHGEKVAFGTLTQLVLENADKAELATVLDFCRTVGLPTTLADLGVTDTSRDRLMRVAELACAPNDTLGNMPFPVTPASVCAAIVGADALGRARAGR
ncbi:glycerol dehydrogenase [Desulfovibrio porci]|uniref:glycerol dehydrogenase n=1 Tax=Desulfovibrio porci TaxID=2605782 RepID=UPI000A78E52C|nr:glycerol dehydrogenase [Desulfovibrio porci]MDY3810972.1 glycerol dehydrogenase [Desulfovibrio porci]